MTLKRAIHDSSILPYQSYQRRRYCWLSRSGRTEGYSFCPAREGRCEKFSDRGDRDHSLTPGPPHPWTLSPFGRGESKHLNLTPLPPLGERVPAGRVRGSFEFFYTCRGFSQESSMPHGGTTKNENYSPPREGCRGGLWRTGTTHPEGYSFCPSPEGIFTGV